MISYQELLDLFFEMHTPADPRWSGTQYRSAIFVHTPEQRAWAQDAVAARGALGRFVAVEDASDFYAAEEYHQKYEIILIIPLLNIVISIVPGHFVITPVLKL